MFQTVNRLVRIAAALAPAAAAPIAHADGLVDLVAPDPWTTYVQVNGTPGDDLIVLASTSSGGIAVTRTTSGVTEAEELDPTVATWPIVIMAGDGNDVIHTVGVAATATLQIDAGAGDDEVLCGPGHDFVLGGEGDDTIDGGEGDDMIFGGPGFADRLYGGPGYDSLSDEDGVAAASGGADDDGISVIFAADWDDNADPYDQRRSIGAIRGDSGSEWIWVMVLGDPLLLTIHADEPGDQDPGIFDIIEVCGAVDPNSTYFGFESYAYYP